MSLVKTLAYLTVLFGLLSAVGLGMLWCLNLALSQDEEDVDVTCT